MLAVDLGLRTGFALYCREGRLLRYFSRSFPNRASLRRGAFTLARQMGPLERIVAEGGGDLLRIWLHTAGRLGIACEAVVAETWRSALLLPRERRRSVKAKRASLELARQVISWSELPAPTALLDDAAEAILIGLWAVRGPNPFKRHSEAPRRGQPE